MKQKQVRFLAVLGIFALLATSVFAGQAQASWGAARLAELTGRTVTPTPTNPDQPQPPAPQPPAPQPSAPQPPAPQPPVSTPVGVGQQETLMLQLVNEERVKNGLKPLQPMAELHNLARLKSADIIQKNYFSHISPTYGSFAKMVYDAGIRFKSVGENLAKARDARHAHILLMASSGHKANILSRNFTHVGIGIVQDKYGVVVTQLFIMQ